MLFGDFYGCLLIHPSVTPGHVMRKTLCIASRSLVSVRIKSTAYKYFPILVWLSGTEYYSSYVLIVVLAV